MSRTKKAVFALAAVALALGIFGCGGGNASAKPEKVTIHVLTQDQAGIKPQEIDQIVKDFEAANPGIAVVMEYVGYDAIHDKIVTGMAATPPAYDASMIDVIWPDELVKNRYLLDVTDRITPEMRAGIFPSAWNGVTRSGRVYGMPWLMDCKYFMYNAEILKKAGFNAPPKTWEELVTQAKAIKKQGLAQYPIIWSWAQLEAVVCDFTVLLYGNGGSFIDASGQPAFNNEKGVQALTWMKQTVDEGLTNPAAITADENAVRDNFCAGKSAFAVNWLFQYSDSNNAKNSTVVGQAAFAPMPVFTAGAAAGIISATVDGSSSFGIMTTTKYPDETWKFLAYFTSNAVQTRFSAEMLPIWKADFEGGALDTLKAAAPTNAVTVPAFAAQFPFAQERPTVAYYNEASRALQQAIQEALTGVKPPKQALDEAAATWIKLAKQ